ncbi:MAG: hypothetical protein LBV79_05770 [Candidatus Adiutrix sp.]|nr:hypothetical protein [Candidatus Adiutrix sp.]
MQNALLYTEKKQETRERPQAAPLLLPSLRSPEEDFAALDQLIRAAGELGGGLLETIGRAPESLPGLVSSLRHYQDGGGAHALPGLDDRSYLALWAVSEHDRRRSAQLLAEAAAKERSMWATLKGEEDAEQTTPQLPPADADRRTLYAWRRWRRLAAPLLRPGDIIVPNAPPEDDDL